MAEFAQHSSAGHQLGLAWCFCLGPVTRSQLNSVHSSCGQKLRGCCCFFKGRAVHGRQLLQAACCPLSLLFSLLCCVMRVLGLSPSSPAGPRPAGMSPSSTLVTQMVWFLPPILCTLCFKTAFVVAESTFSRKCIALLKEASR